MLLSDYAVVAANGVRFLWQAAERPAIETARGHRLPSF